MMHGQLAVYPAVPHRLSLTVLFGLFLRVAMSSFGGYMAMISATRHSVVERHKLLSDQDVLDGVSLASVLPGPQAINVVAHVGYLLRGNVGACVAVFAAMTPAFMLMLLLSMVYLESAQGLAFASFFQGVVPAVMAIVAVAALNMWRSSPASRREAGLALAAASAALVFNTLYTTPVIIVAAALLGAWWFDAGAQPARTAYLIESDEVVTDEITDGLPLQSRSMSHSDSNLLLLSAAATPFGMLACFKLAVLLKLLCMFAGMSLLLFGGAYVFIPLLQHTVVDGNAWLTQREFVDAVAMGQMMPGPVVVVATFIGYKVAGVGGACVATLGIVMPSMVLMLMCSQMLERIKTSRYVSAALRGVRAAVVGEVFAAAVLIGKSAVPGLLTVCIGAAALLALLRYRVEAIWIIPVAGLIGFFAY